MSLQPVIWLLDPSPLAQYFFPLTLFLLLHLTPDGDLIFNHSVGSRANYFARILIGTPSPFMPLSRSPSPVPGGGWSSPGLALNSGRSSPANVSGGPVMWESAKMRHHNPSGYPTFSTQNKGFFSRHMRRISSSLPRFNGQYAEKEKLGRGRRWVQKVPLLGRIKWLYRRIGRRARLALLLMLIFIFCYTIFYTTRKSWLHDFVPLDNELTGQ